MNNLNSQQQAAVDSTALTTYVVAAPGSGKSATIIARVQELIRRGVDPARIWLLTFTQVGAHVFRERLAALGIKVGVASTLHSVMFRLLQEHGDLLGYTAGQIGLINQEERDELLEATRIQRGVKTKREVKERRTRDAQLVWAAFEDKMKRSNVLDYDGVLRQGLKLLAMQPDGIEIEELLIDEAQDSGEEDWAIYDALPALSRFIVADPDQSIFAFRGAKPEIFTTRAEQDCGWSTTFLLETNYRSAPEICAAANSLIQHNATRVVKWCMATEDAPSGAVCHCPVVDEANELAYIADALGCLHNDCGIVWSQMAVLTRNNNLAAAVRAHLRSCAIRVDEPARQEMPEDWSLCLATIAALHAPTNSIVTRRLLKEQGMEPAEIARMQSGCDIAGEPLRSVTWAGNIESLPAALVEHGISPASIALVQSRITILSQEQPTIGDLLHDLYSHEAQYGQPEANGVHVGTAHSAKGREWDVVMVAGCEKEIWERGEIEDGRRLFYVAMTRARRWLYFTSASSRRGFNGRPADTTLTRFVEEAMDHE